MPKKAKKAAMGAAVLNQQTLDVIQQVVNDVHETGVNVSVVVDHSVQTHLSVGEIEQLNGIDLIDGRIYRIEQEGKGDMLVTTAGGTTEKTVNAEPGEETSVENLMNTIAEFQRKLETCYNERDRLQNKIISFLESTHTEITVKPQNKSELAE